MSGLGSFDGHISKAAEGLMPSQASAQLVIGGGAAATLFEDRGTDSDRRKAKG